MIYGSSWGLWKKHTQTIKYLAGHAGPNCPCFRVQAVTIMRRFCSGVAAPTSDSGSMNNRGFLFFAKIAQLTFAPAF